MVRRFVGRRAGLLVCVAAGCALAVAGVAWPKSPLQKLLADASDASSKAAEIEITPGSTISARASLASYQAGIRAGLFGVPAPPTAPSPVTPVPVAPTPAVPSAPQEPEPIFSGMVVNGTETLAMVEDPKTKAGRYLGVGDPLLGGVIEKITMESISIRLGTTERTLAMKQDFSLTPLDKSAPYLQGGSGDGAGAGSGGVASPGAEGQPARGPGGRGGGGPGGGRGGRGGSGAPGGTMMFSPGGGGGAPISIGGGSVSFEIAAPAQAYELSLPAGQLTETVVISR